MNLQCLSLEVRFLLQLAGSSEISRQGFSLLALDQSPRGALDDPDNKDCLIRPYLGVRRQDLGEHNHGQGTTLRNFPVNIDQVEDLGMDPIALAKEIALGLVAGHWAARIDIMDVEFVIGSCSTTPDPLQPLVAHAPVHSDVQSLPTAKGEKKSKKKGDKKQERPMLNIRDIIRGNLGFKKRPRPIRLWLLDFDKTYQFQILPDSWKGRVSALVIKTRTNDPYYPSEVPETRAEYKVWKTFFETYILASSMVLQHITGLNAVRRSDRPLETIEKLPGMVMKEWYKQEAAGLDKEPLCAIKERAKVEKWDEEE